MKKLCIAMALAACFHGEAAAQLTAVSAAVTDASGASRTSFTNAESVTLRQSVSNATFSAAQIYFTFKITAPSGAVVFSHSGNSAPATPGIAQSQLSGISIRSFYTTPGSYTFVGTATLAPYPAVTQQVSFMVSSPNITLIYPPDGARGLSDKPLVFRWTASGASRYRVTVADNAGLYNPANMAYTSGETSYSYPDNPTEPRQQLVADQVYYWKVEGLDPSGNAISASNVYSFSLRSQPSAVTRNVAMTGLSLDSSAADLSKALMFTASLSNTGASTEYNVSVKMSLGGIPAQDSPKQVLSIAPGETKRLSYTAFMPQGQEQGLGVACADLFDDNVTDNCRTLLVAKDSGGAAQQTKAAGSTLSYDEMFQEIIKRLGPDAAKSLEGYTFETLSCANCSKSELSAIISSLISGDAQLVSASVQETAPPQAAAPAAAAKDEKAPSQEAPETNLELAAPREQSPGEWTGYTEPAGAGELPAFVIRDKKEWKKAWGRVSSSDAPDVDFASKMVAGIIASAADRSESVRILGKRKTDDGVVFDYYVIEAPAGEKPRMAAYIFKLFERSDEKVSFKRLDEPK
jgi:hypothetical protein